MPQPGEVWIADIPFTNGAASKLRPVGVLAQSGAEQLKRVWSNEIRLRF
jgi:hypothetical protein